MVSTLNLAHTISEGICANVLTDCKRTVSSVSSKVFAKPFAISSLISSRQEIILDTDLAHCTLTFGLISAILDSQIWNVSLCVVTKLMVDWCVRMSVTRLVAEILKGTLSEQSS